MNHANDIPDRTRDGKGRYTHSVATAERHAQAVRLHDQGYTYRAIADEPGIAVSTAYMAVERAIDHVLRQPAEDAIATSLHNLAAERGRLMDLRRDLEALQARPHATVQHGKVVYDEATGEPVPDHEFQLKVADRLIKIDDQLRRNDESRRKLEGLDQPAKTNISGGVTYEIIGMATPEETQ